MLLQLSMAAAENSGNNDGKSSGDNTIRVIVSPELRDLDGICANDFAGLQGGADVEIMPAESGDIKFMAVKNADFAIVSGKVPEEMENEFVMAIGRSIIVPVINRENPFMESLYRKGITRGELAGLMSGETRGWEQLIPGGNKPVHVYMLSDESARHSMAGYTGVATSLFKNENIVGAEEVIAAVAKDPLAIGLRRLADLKGSTLAGQVTCMPIDRNENGKLDYIEMIYQDAGSFEHGV